MPHFGTDVLFVASGSSIRAVRQLSCDHYGLIVAEDARAAGVLEGAGLQRYELLADLVPLPRDVYDPSVRAISWQVIRGLASALETSRWVCEGVALWDVIVVDLLWQYLDPLRQAVELARGLLTAATPKRLVVTGSCGTLSRAIAAVANVNGICVAHEAFRGSDGWSAEVRARLWPALGHLRECVSARRITLGSRSPCRAPFLLVNHAARNFAVMRPVLERLRILVGDDRVLVVQIDGRGSREEGHEAGRDESRKTHGTAIRYCGLSSYVYPVCGLRALRAVQPIVSMLTSGTWRGRVERAGLAWDGMPLSQLADYELSFGLARLVGNAAREIAAARAALAAERPALVMLTDERSGIGRAFGLSARSLGVPSLMIQWGPIAPNATWTAGIAADVAAVEGEIASEVIRSCDNKPGLDVVVVGQPKYDVLPSEAAAADRGAICARYGLDPARPIVLYASHPVSEASAPMRHNAVEATMFAQEVQVVCRAGADLPGVQLAVKPHPNEGTDVHSQAVADCRHPDLRLIPKGDPIYPLLFVADCVVTRQSTAGTEALVLGKPVVIVNLTGRPDAVPYVLSGAAIGAYRSEEVKPAIERALYDRDLKRQLPCRAQAFLQGYASQGSRSATERLVTLALNTSAHTIERAS